MGKQGFWRCQVSMPFILLGFSASKFQNQFFFCKAQVLPGPVAPAPAAATTFLYIPAEPIRPIDRSDRSEPKKGGVWGGLRPPAFFYI